jgi:hypothetical protein
MQPYGRNDRRGRCAMQIFTQVPPPSRNDSLAIFKKASKSMAESPEHAYLSQTFLKVLNNFSNSQLYTYRESDRSKFDVACMLTEAWDCVLNGQTLWKHTEGIDKDLRTLLVASDAPLVTYVARDTTKHRSVITEAIGDYRKIRQGLDCKRFKVFWVPADFDADSEKERQLVESQLEHEITEDILLNVLFGRLSASRVHAIAVMKPSTSNLGLELAILRSIALNGFTSLGWLGHEFKVSSGTVRERIYRLQMSGLILQEGPFSVCARNSTRSQTTIFR